VQDLCANNFAIKLLQAEISPLKSTHWLDLLQQLFGGDVSERGEPLSVRD
jgi:hypothetical protein